jgi:hypothetical protein
MYGINVTSVTASTLVMSDTGTEVEPVSILPYHSDCSWRIMPNVWDHSKQKNGTAVQLAGCKSLSSFDGAGSRPTMGEAAFLWTLQSRLETRASSSRSRRSIRESVCLSMLYASYTQRQSIVSGRALMRKWQPVGNSPSCRRQNAIY